MGAARRKDSDVIHLIRRNTVFLLATILAFGSILLPVATTTAQGGATPAVAPPSAGLATPVADDPDGTVDLDVLFIGAHPDDEAFGLSTYGQWNEYAGLEVGVITITRGEGGGNAVGVESGPALGLLREQEERRAVAPAGIDHIYYLDKVDFYYTVSAPLTEEVWGYEDTLERVVRVVRSTTPEVIISMNPAPTPGNHGHHQMAARFAVAAYYAAGSSMFPDQIEEEGLPAFAPDKVFRGGFAGEGTTGESCSIDFMKTEPTDVVYGVWSGVVSERHGGQTWAEVERQSQREYASQGWSVFPDVSDDPDELGCDYFTLIDSRVPFTLGNAEPTAMVEGALIPTTGGLPAGTLFGLEPSRFDVLAGEPFEVDVVAKATTADVTEMAISYELPEGWTSELVGSSVSGPLLEETVSIIPSEDADPATRYRLVATLTIDGATGQNVEVVQVAPPVEAHLEALPQIQQFREWTEDVGAPQLDKLIKPVVPMGVGETRNIDVAVTNNTDELQDATVTLLLAPGFTADSETLVATNLAGGNTTTLTFEVTNEDTSVPTSVEGGIDGDYLLDITVVGAGIATTEQAGINLVPVVSVPAADASATPVATPSVAGATPIAAGPAPTVDGTIMEGEYTSDTLDVSRVWEGEEPDSPEDASAQAWLSYDEDGIYVGVEVTDEAQGTILPADDAKRHWRTDSVEIAIDPLGTAENTSGTFKVGIFPEVQEGGPAAYRDADAFQGPISETAPGMEVASSVSDPYTGYVIETFIPFEALPAPVDPDELAMNIFVYDSDTDDLTGQTRLGWSVWRGVQGDPYRWGHVTLEGYTATDGGELDEPRIPLEAAQSANSPWSIIQSANDGVGLAGLPVVSDAAAMHVTEGPTVVDGVLTATISSGDASGTVHVFAVQDTTVLAEQSEALTAGSTIGVSRDVGEPDPASITFAASLVTDDEHVQAVAAPDAP